MPNELSIKIARIQDFILEQELSSQEMLVLVGFLQSQAYEHLQNSLLNGKDR